MARCVADNSIAFARAGCSVEPGYQRDRSALCVTRSARGGLSCGALTSSALLLRLIFGRYVLWCWRHIRIRPILYDIVMVDNARLDVADKTRLDLRSDASG